MPYNLRIPYMYPSNQGMDYLYDRILCLKMTEKLMR